MHNNNLLGNTRMSAITESSKLWRIRKVGSGYNYYLFRCQDSHRRTNGFEFFFCIVLELSTANLMSNFWFLTWDLVNIELHVCTKLKYSNSQSTRE